MSEKQCQAETLQLVQCNNGSQPCCASAAQFETETILLFCLSDVCQALAGELYNLVGVLEPQCKMVQTASYKAWHKSVVFWIILK